MTYGTHLATGLAAAGCLVPVLAPRIGLSAALLWACMLGVGSVWPDVDTSSTAASRRHPLLRLIYLGTLGVVSLLAVRLRGHRTLTHSLLGIVLSVAVFAGVAWSVHPWVVAYLPLWVPERELWTASIAGGFFLGTTLHVGMDAATLSGVPLLLPYKTRSHFIVPELARVRMDTGYFRERRR